MRVAASVVVVGSAITDRVIRWPLEATRMRGGNVVMRALGAGDALATRAMGASASLDRAELERFAASGSP